MRNTLIAVVGFVVGSAMVAGIGLAARTTTPTVKQTPVVAIGMNGGMGSMMGAAATPAAAKLFIVHVQRGCHVWSNGNTTAATLRMRLKSGQRLAIRDMDVDAHQMLEFSGPARVHLGGPMMMNTGRTLSFPKPGVYRLGTKTVEMPGAMEVKTIGPDNNLRLVVTVA